MFRSSLVSITLSLLTLSGAALAGDDEARVRYDDHKVVRTVISSLDQIDKLHDLGARLMSCHEGLGVVDYLVAPDLMDDLQATNIPFEVINDNIQRDIDAEYARLQAQGEVSPRDITWFNDYKNYDAVNAKLTQMVADRPDLVSMYSIGTSLQGRQIYGIKITGPGTNKPAIQLNGCHHAREWITVMVPMWIADKLIYSYDTDPTLHALVDALEWYIIPIVNVDGYVYTWQTDRLWRKNRRLNAGGCYGVDDNRNYSVGFGGGGSSSDPCSETYRGTVAFSEPETLAMKNFTQAHPNIVTSHSYHSYSQLVMSPYGYTNTLPADHSTFMEMNAAMAAAILAVHGVSYNYGPIYSTIYQASGNDVDWYYDVEGIFSFVTELRDTGYYGFELPPAQIIPNCEEIFPAALYQGDWATSPVKISFPQGLPTRLDPLTPVNVPVRIKVIGGAVDPNTPRLYTRIGLNGNFVPANLTLISGDNWQATLPATPCGQTLYYYFTAASTTGIVGYSPTDAPNSTHSAPAIPIVVVLDQPLDASPGWTIEGSWAFGTPTGQGNGNKDPNSGHTCTKVYGYNLNGNYTNNMPERNLTTTTINCTGKTGLKLSYWRWLGVERSLYDHAYIRISNNGGTTWSTVLQNPYTNLDDCAWINHEVDISAYADNKPNVKLRWTMGTTDGGLVFCGWNIDDIKIWGPDPNGCPEVPGDMNCDGLVDFDDINAFVLALSDPGAYYAAYPTCNILNGDFDGDGVVDFDDINPFVALLSR